MVLNSEKYSCCGCETCKNICPKQCIHMEQDAEGFKYPKIDNQRCIECNLCEKNCPLLNPPKMNVAQYSIAAFNFDEEVRKNSTSGGVFFLMAKAVIERHGAVYGVICNNEGRVQHARAEVLRDVYPMLGSKYVQSELGNSYIEVLQDLEDGRHVLFSGTPCQAAGLKNFLNTKKVNTNKLCIIDLVCHGVPSSMVWDYYRQTQILTQGEKIERISFRDKISGWKCYSLTVKTDQNLYQRDANHDKFIVAFRKNLSLRPSCYACKFKGIKGHCADITLADFWGISEELPNYYDDDKGVSWATANSEKGEKQLKEINAFMWFQQVKVEQGLRHNASALEAAKLPITRKAFFNGICAGKDFNKITMKAIGETGLLGVLRKIKRVILK